MVAVLTSEEGFNPNEERSQFKGDGNVIEEEVPGQELSLGWSISRVVFARDVVCVYHLIMAL